MSDPAVLLVTSAGAPAGSVVPVLAAVEAAGLRVRAIDVGRAGIRSDNPLDKVVQALAGELAERRLMRELAAHPPDVTVAFDPATATALGLVRDDAIYPAPVLAVVAELQPDGSWAAADADRYLTVDDEAAVALAEQGVEEERILTVGPLCEHAFAEVARTERKPIRAQYRLASGAPVVVVDVAGFGYESTAQIAMQLSLVTGNATFLFDAGSDADAAAALRHQVPTLDMRAKLFGKTEDAARFWRCADVVVARPTYAAVARAMTLGARMVCFAPEGKEQSLLAQAVEERGLGATASTTLLLSSALEPLLRQTSRSDDRSGADGAATIADMAWVVAQDRRGVVEERRAQARASTRSRVDAAASAAEAAARTASAAGDLEDLGGNGAAQASASATSEPGEPDPKEIARLRTEVRERVAQLGKTVTEARQAAERWDAQQAQARGRGDTDAARAAERKGDAERTRMHEALSEMAQMQAELDRLEKAAAAARAVPPRRSRPSAPSSGAGATRASARGASQPSVDDLLERMKRQQGGGAPRSSQGGASRGRQRTTASGARGSTVDDELEALKRKMSKKKTT